MKILFLDIDGPMIPWRAVYMEKNYKKLFSQFDPVAVAFVNRLIDCGVKIVISSSWAMSGYEAIKEAFKNNNIALESIHEDWMTPRPTGKVGSKYRTEQIQLWLDAHPEVTHYVSLDDIEIDLPGAVTVDYYNGLLFEQMEEIFEIFEIDSSKLNKA